MKKVKASIRKRPKSNIDVFLGRDPAASDGIQILVCKILTSARFQNCAKDWKKNFVHNMNKEQRSAYLQLNVASGNKWVKRAARYPSSKATKMHHVT